MLTLFRNIFSPPRDMILVMAAIWLGISLAEKRASKQRMSANDLNNLVFYPLLGYVLGGRILFAIENLSAFAKSPLNIFSLNIDLFDPIGGLAVALIVAFVYGQRKEMSLWPTLDALTPFFAIFAVGLALAHLASGSAFGSPTSLPWGMDLWGTTRHPSQVYALLASLLVFGLLWFRKTDSPPGVYFLTFIAITSGWRLFLEAFRGDSTLIFGGIRSAQIVAWIVLALSLFLLDKFGRKSSQKVVTRSHG